MTIEDIKKISSNRTIGIWRLSHIPVNCGHNIDSKIHYSDLWYAISPPDTMDKSICNANFIAMAANNIDKIIAVLEAVDKAAADGYMLPYFVNEALENLERE